MPVKALFTMEFDLIALDGDDLPTVFGVLVHA
jgi:hypothetical protein